ncbi:MAG: hypothetical protein IVW55_06270 [Chloroflexi bacterium]|nr:hypothetical protein [Chloroflexota bacterium]
MAAQDEEGTQRPEDGASTIEQPRGAEPEPTAKPSQAEGDRDTISADLKEKESEGKLER